MAAWARQALLDVQVPDQRPRPLTRRGQRRPWDYRLYVRPTGTVPTVQSTLARRVGGGTAALSFTATDMPGLAVGDLMIFSGEFVATATATPKLPSVSWTIPSAAQQAWNSSSGGGAYMAWKLADAGDVAGGTITFDISANGLAMLGAIRRITGHDPVTPIDGNGANLRTTSGASGVMPGLTTSGPDRLVIGSLFQFAASTPSGSQFNNVFPSGTTLGDHVENAATLGYYQTVHYSQATSGATGTKTVAIVTASGADAFEALALAVKPITGSPYTLAASTAAYVLSGTAVALKRGRKLVAASASYSLAGSALGLRSSHKLVASSASYVLAGTALGFARGRVLAATTAAYVLTGSAVTLTKSSGNAYTLPAASGSFALAGTAAALLLKRKLVAASGAYLLTGTANALHKGRTLAAVSGSYSLSGTALSFKRKYVLSALAGNYALSGADAALLWSGESFWRPVSPVPETWTVSVVTAEIWTPVAPNPDPWTSQ